MGCEINQEASSADEPGYQYKSLPTPTAFRVVELLPGRHSHPISCALHKADWAAAGPFEALSYAWGDPTKKAVIRCNRRDLEVTESLHSALSHLRYPDRSRFLWADAVCINQSDFPERGQQVAQMRKIYQSAEQVLIWLGPDKTDLAGTAVESLVVISDFLCETLGVSLSDLARADDVYQEIIFRNKSKLPLPNECAFSKASVWDSLRWFYSHKYFTRVWVIQEVNSHQQRWVHCGSHKVEWSRVELVAGYIIMETAFSKSHNFSEAYCWYASMVSTQRIRQPRNWVFMLYLASNFSSTDERDAIYGLLGLLEVPEGYGLLQPDYTKSTVQVYQDSVEAALAHFRNTDVLLYARGDMSSSWVPNWNHPMLFRNPFRFGRPLPWKPAGESEAGWTIDRERGVLSLEGHFAGTVDFAETYNESCFGNAQIDDEKGEQKDSMTGLWRRILLGLQSIHAQLPLPADSLMSTAASFSYGLDETSTPASETLLLRNFVAYLKLVLDEKTYNEFIPAELIEDSKQVDGRVFGKPVWDFQYPDSSFFITNEGLTGCCISVCRPGDVVYIPLGSTYPLVLTPHGGDLYRIRGYTYTHGVMIGERFEVQKEVVNIE